MITISIMLANIMQGVDNTILNVALPHVQGSLSASLDQIAWALTSYIVCAAIMMPLTGWLAGRFGIKYIFLVSVIGFTLASALCGAATSLAELVLFRALQGVAGAGLIPLSQATLLQINPPERHGYAMAVFGIGTILGPIMGPALGGWLTYDYSWRWVFYINLPVGVLCTLGILVFIRQSANVHREPFDFVGFLTLSLGIGALQLMLDRGELKDWFRFERDLDRGDRRRARLLSFHRAHGNHRRALVSQPRLVEERQFCGRHSADVLWRPDHDRHPGAVADDAAKPDELSGTDHRASDRAARHRLDDRDVPRRPADQPGRQPAAHSVRPAADRGLDVADEPVLAADGHGAGDHLRAVAGFRAWLHPSAAQHHRAVDPAAPYPDPGDGDPQPNAQPRWKRRH